MRLLSEVSTAWSFHLDKPMLMQVCQRNMLYGRDEDGLRIGHGAESGQLRCLNNAGKEDF